MDSKSQLSSFCILCSTNGTCDANSEAWVIRTGQSVVDKVMNNSPVPLSCYLAFFLVQIRLVVNLLWQHISATVSREMKPLPSRCQFLQHATKPCSLSLSGRQGQVKGSYCHCLLMGPAQGSDGRVISVMMMVMVSYRLPRVPQVHTYLWHATCLSQPEHICLTTGPFGCLPKQNRSITTILLASH